MIAVRASNGKGMRGREKKKKETRGDKAWLRIFHTRHHFFFFKNLSRSRRRKRWIARNIDPSGREKYSVSGEEGRGEEEEEGRRENSAA